MLDEEYRPLGVFDPPDEEGNDPRAPRPPLFPERLQGFEYACALVAEVEELKARATV